MQAAIFSPFLSPRNLCSERNCSESSVFHGFREEMKEGEGIQMCLVVRNKDLEGGVAVNWGWYGDRLFQMCEKERERPLLLVVPLTVSLQNFTISRRLNQGTYN